MEIKYEVFEGGITLAVPFAESEIKAGYHNGFLEVLVPRAVPRRPERVAIHVEASDAGD